MEIFFTSVWMASTTILSRGFLSYCLIRRFKVTGAMAWNRSPRPLMNQMITKPKIDNLNAFCNGMSGVQVWSNIDIFINWERCSLSYQKLHVGSKKFFKIELSEGRNSKSNFLVFTFKRENLEIVLVIFFIFSKWFFLPIGKNHSFRTNRTYFSISFLCRHSGIAYFENLFAIVFQYRTNAGKC